MRFETSKNLSAVGSLLIVIGFLPFVPYVGFLSFVGIILLLIGLKGLASFYQEKGIFENPLYAIIIGIVGAIISAITLFFTAASTLATIGIDIYDPNDWANFATKFTEYFSDPANIGELISLAAAAVIALIILFAFVIIAMFFFRKSLIQLSEKSGIGLFGTAGLLVLIGAVLSIFVIGIFIIWIGFILATWAFFKMSKPETPAKPEASA